MARFKVGDVIKIKRTDYHTNLPEGSIVRIEKIDLNDSNFPYHISRKFIKMCCGVYHSSEFKMATDREKFLYLIYGPHIPGVREWVSE